MCFKKSETYKNLQTAFAGESKACTKYNFFALKAKEDGYEQIAAFFEETARNEQEHAEIWYKWLQGKGELPPTVENLQEAANGEEYEWKTMYKDFARTAYCEGYEELAKMFLRVANIEQKHEERYRKLIANMQTNEVFCKPQQTMWICRVCGHVTIATCSPKVCPVCEHPQAFTEIKATNY